MCPKVKRAVKLRNGALCFSQGCLRLPTRRVWSMWPTCGWQALHSQWEFEDVGEIEVFCAAGCPVGWLARYGKRNSEHRDQTRANRWRSCSGMCQVGRLILRLAAWQSVEGPASRWSCKHTRQDGVPISHPPWRPELYTLTLVYTLTLKDIWQS